MISMHSPVHRTTAPCARPMLLAAAAASLAFAARSQVAWSIAHASQINYHAMVYDTVRGRTLLFGGIASVTASPTWEWDGTAWSSRSPAYSPAQRWRHAMAYDSARGRAVVFGGFGTVACSKAETWEYDGTTWSQVFPATAPGPRVGCTMVFDAARGRTLLFGGEEPAGLCFPGTIHGDTWTWDGTSWVQLAPANSPSPRVMHAMVQDTVRGRTVLFGGAGVIGPHDDTWEWDGATWLPMAPANRPSGRTWHAMAFDSQRGRTVLFGGQDIGGYAADTWEWDGTNWTQSVSPTVPTRRVQHAMAYDPSRGRTVLTGGVGGPGMERLGDTWEWDGAVWTDRTAAVPPVRAEHAMAFDPARGETVMFGGWSARLLGDTWEWNGLRWRQLLPASSPSARRLHAMAHDAGRARTLLFGGFTSTALLADTWEWDGTVWQQRLPVSSPPARLMHALAADGARARIVLFGGDGGNGLPLGDTWEWDGSDWSQKLPTSAPLARYAHAMAYDAARARTVLFSGLAVGTPADTWEWDGTLWTLRAPPSSPPPRHYHRLAYDRARGRTVLFGGLATATGLNATGTWEWTGATWIQRLPVISPAGRANGALVYDAARDRTVLFGGNGPGWLADTWEYAPVDPAHCTPFGAGCPGTAGTPVLRPRDGRPPWLGAVFTAVAGPVPVGAGVFVGLGLSRTAIAGWLLPLPLVAYGMPACSLLTSWDVLALVVADARGIGSHALAIPGAPALLGFELFLQAAALDAAANAGGLVFTDALACRIGAP